MEPSKPEEELDHKEQSDEENDLNTLNTEKSHSGSRKILDSDSEAEMADAEQMPEVVSESKNRIENSPELEPENKRPVTPEEVTRVVKKKKSIIRAIVDSDSDEEPVKSIENDLVQETELSGSSNTKNSEDEDIIDEQSTTNKNNIRRKSRIFAMADSDSEEEAAQPQENRTSAVMGDEEESNNQKSSNTEFEDDQSNPGDPTTDSVKRKSKPLAIVDSDSEEEQPKSPNDNTSGNILGTEEFSPEAPMDSPYQKSRLSALCDAESSADEHYSSDDQQARAKTQIKQKKNRKKEVKEKPPKPMTGKEAALQRKEIRAESQRMLRESRVSLPYHRPKSYSLAEFLQKRSKLPTTAGVIPKASPAVAIKMTRDQLEIVSKTLDERIKEVEQFFKSDSEHEEEEKQDQQHTDDENTADAEKEKDKDEASHLAEETMELPVSEVVENLLSQMLEDVSNATENMNIEQLSSGRDENVTVSDPSDEGKKQNEQVLTEQDENLDTSAPDKTNNSENTEEQNDQEMCTTQVEDTNLTSKGTEELQKSDTVQQKTSRETSEDQFDSMQYEFNLDGMEDTETDSHILHTDSSSKMQIEDQPVKKYSEDCDELLNKYSGKVPTEHAASKELSDRMKRANNSSILADTSSSNKQLESTVAKKKFTKLQLLKEKFAGKQPKLSGNPDEVIDLETGVAKPDKVRELVERFIKHTTVSHHPHKSKVEVNVISLSGAEVRNETVAVNVDDEEEPIPVMEIPGAKLQKLREELQEQMAQRRSELWQQRQTGGNCEDEEEGEVDDDGKSDNPDDDILDDEEEETEMTDESNSEDEIEDDCEVTEKAKTMSAFVDEEAEESDIQDDDDDVEDNNEEPEDGDDDDDDDEEETEADENDENSTENKTSENNQESSNTKPLAQKKVLRRILKPFHDDDDSEEEEGQEMTSKNSDAMSEERDTSMTEKDANTSSASCDDDYALPPNLPKLHKTPQRPTTQQQSKSGYDFLTPVSYLTGLQNLNSDSKFLKESPVISPFRMPLDPSPLKDTTWQNGLQKKLFQDQPENTTDELSDLCSGTFPETQQPSTQDLETVSVAQNTAAGEDTAPSTQDLLDICSGTFTQSQNAQSLEKESQEMNKSLEHENQVNGSQQEEITHLDEEQDAIISQLLNEDEMEQFKKKFDSPVVTNPASSGIGSGTSFLDGLGQQQVTEVNATGLIDSDDENDELKVGRRKQKKLVFSDDSSDDEDPQQLNPDDEEIDLHDDNLDDSNSEISPEDPNHNEDPDDIAYDSEENEISQPQKQFRMQDFVENEAELSESEWGSADEDENDLDELEFEKGDAEVYDEKKLRSDLEKIHMRRLLDDDNREVKLLQELLLEDGELHGSGRQRQFRWKNIDSVDTGEDSKRDEEDIYFDEEDESEEQFRKMRHHREMFLKKQNSENGDQDDLNSILSDSQILSVGQKIIMKSRSFNKSNNSQNNGTPPPAVPVENSEAQVKQTFSILNKRGSFLSRGDQVLQRLAEYTKTTSTNTVVAGSVKNSRSFLFQSASTVETATVAQNNKRKAADGTPKILKKLRLADMSPNVDKKAEKSGGSNKKLFGNI